MRTLLRNNGLSIAMFGLFLLCWAGQAAAGHRHYNQDREEHGQTAIGLVEYLGTGHFIEATFENWESEFLQMAAFVLFSAFLYQRGSGESKDPDAEEDVDKDPWTHRRPDSPGPVRRGGFALKLYSNSLCLALLGLFLFSFAMHAIGGSMAFNEEARLHGQPLRSLTEFLGTSDFWFQSFQNWQSEFLSVGALVILSIFLRQRGSPESKPVFAPHSQTGR